MIFFALFIPVPGNCHVGDLNNNGCPGLEDVILALQVTSGINPSDIYKNNSLDGTHIALEDAIYVLQAVAGVREQACTETRTNSLGMTFKLMRPGTFMMGSPEGELGRQGDETQQETVIDRYYYIQTTEVTQSQWQTVMENNPSRFQYGGAYPVENVSWNEVKSFIAAMNGRGNGTYRLPKEKEWEYAARSGSSTAFSSGDIANAGCSPIDPNLNAVGWYAGNANGMTHPAGKKTANARGLYDMHGNVWEWCEDAHPADPYLRVIRGGSWAGSAAFARSANRAFSGIYCKCHGATGFRLVLEP